MHRNAADGVAVPLHVRRVVTMGGALAALVLAGMVWADGAMARARGAAALPPTTMLQSLATGFFLYNSSAGNISGSDAGNTVSGAGKWRVQPSSFGTVTLTNVYTGRCLDSNAEGRVYTLGCNGGSFQKWQVLDRDFGTVVLKNLATGRVLDGDARRRIYALFENGGAYQKWRPIAA